MCQSGGWGRGCGHTSSCPLPHPQKPLWLFCALWCRPGTIGKRWHSQSSVASGSLAIQTMEFSHWNVLSFLNSPIELCLSICSAFLDTDPNLTFLCGLWLLLLFLCYLVGIPSLSTFWKTKAFQKVRNAGEARNSDSLLFLSLSPYFKRSLVGSERQLRWEVWVEDGVASF